MSSSNLQERYQACIALGIVGDKIGFGNGETEFFTGGVMRVDDYPDLKAMGEQITMTMIFTFIAAGGIQGIDLSKLNYSDDSVMMLDNLRALISPSSRDAKSTIDNVAKEYLKSFSNMDEMVNLRLAGRQTINSMQSIIDGSDWRSFPYSGSAGGSGGAMRSMVIGLAYPREQDLDALLEIAIESCAITHNNGVAFMGSITAALFTALAVRGVPPVAWAGRLLELIDSGRIQAYLRANRPKNLKELTADVARFRSKWARYVEDSIKNDQYAIADDALRAISPAYRMTYYFTNFSETKTRYFPGAGSDDAVIMAYDMLLLSGANFEKLVYTAMIHVGDSDTTGIIAASWYGAYYGFRNVPAPILDTFHDLPEFKRLADQLFARYVGPGGSLSRSRAAPRRSRS